MDDREKIARLAHAEIAGAADFYGEGAETWEDGLAEQSPWVEAAFRVADAVLTPNNFKEHGTNA